MQYSYHAVTAAATEAIEAMEKEIYDSALCDAGLLVSLAAGIYWAWTGLVGEAARQSDADRMIFAISVLQARRKAIALSLLNSRERNM
jgi:hypothetical protein